MTFAMQYAYGAKSVRGGMGSGRENTEGKPDQVKKGHTFFVLAY